MNIEDIVTEHASWIRRKAHQYYHNDTDADDLASETIYKCLANSDKFRRGMSFKPWAQTIMENTYITQYNRRRCVMFSGYGDYDTYEGCEYADQLAAINHILSVVKACGNKSINIECVMLYADGYTIAEIAEMLGVPTGTVKSRICLGRRMLRGALNC